MPSHRRIVHLEFGDVTLCRLPRLGHTLGPAASLVDDCGRVPSATTLAPIAPALRALLRDRLRALENISKDPTKP